MKIVAVTAKQTANIRSLAPPLTLHYFWQSIMNAGAAPLLVPILDVGEDESWHPSLKLTLGVPAPPPNVPQRALAQAEALLSRVDSLLLTGGEDMGPQCYGCDPSPDLGTVNWRRDASELLLAYLAIARGMPVLAVCRGMQVVNTLLRGKLHQHLTPDAQGIVHERAYAEVPADYWAPQHSIRFTGPSRLADCFDGEPGTEITSYHHQAIDQVAPGLRVTAVADDGCIEAFEAEDPTRFLVGIQGHPEVMWSHGYPRWLRIFRALVAA